MKGELEDLGEEYDNIESISKIQTQILNLTSGKVNIFDDNGNFRSTYDILKDISEIYDKLSDTDKADLTEILFGKMRGNQGIAIIQAFQSGQIDKAYEAAKNSAGSAQKEFDAWSQSIEAHINTFKASFESLSQTIVNSDLIKFIVDSGTEILNTIDNIVNSIGTIPTLLSGIAAVGVFKNAGVFKDLSVDILGLIKNYKTLNVISKEQSVDIQQLVKGFNDLKESGSLVGKTYQEQIDKINTLNNDNLTNIFQKVAEGAENARVNIVDAYAAILDGNTHGLQNIQSIFNTYNDTLKDNVKEQKNFTAAVGQSNITLSKYLATVGTDGKAGLAGYAGYLATATAKTIGLQIATTALNAGISMLVGWGISMLAKGLDEMIVTAEEAAQAAEEARKKAVESAEAYKDEADSLKELQSRYTELIASTNDISTVKDELASIQDELINKYGDEAEAIDVVNGKYAETIALIKEKQLEEAKDYTRTNKANYDKAVNKTQKVEHTDWIKTDNSLRTVIEENAKQFGWLAVAGNYYGDEQPDVYLEDNKFSINGNLQERYEILTKIMESYGKQKDYNIETYNLLVDETSAIKEQLDAYNQIISQYEEAQKLINNIEIPQETKKEFNDLLNKSVEAYNTLNTSNSPAARGEAYEELKSLETALKNLAGNNTDLQQIVTDTFNSFKLGVDNTNTSLTTLSKTFSDYLDNDFKSATDNISKIQDAIMNIAKGEYINNADFWELFNLDENGLLGIPTVIDGKFKVSIEKLIALKDEYINKQKEQIKLDQEEARLAINNAYKNLSIEERKLNDLRSKVNSTGDIQALKAQEQVVQEIKDSISGYRDIISKDSWLIQVLNSNLGYTKEIVDSLTESLQEQADNLLKAQENQIDKIVDKLNSEKSTIEDSKKELEEQLKVLEEQKDEIEEIISNYEKVSDIVSETIQSEIDSLEENRQSVEDYYDEMINKLQETNDERQESINLAEKLAALENAKNNKVRVFDETRGWTYEADKSAIESAQEDLLNTQNEAEISRLEKEKKAALAGYDAQIEPLQEYEKQWSDSLKGITDAENEALAEQILGADWREKIKAQDTEILTQFQNNYGTYKTRLHNLVSGEIADLNNSIKAKDNEIEAKERQIESWQKYKTEIQNAAEEINGAFKDYTDNLNQLTLDENASYEDRLKNFDDFIYSYAEKVGEINNLKKSISGLEDDSAIQQLTDQLSFINEYMEGIQKILDRLQDSSTGFGIVNSAWDAKLIQGSHANGGVVDYTGLAQMHGTKSASETVFNARDSKKLYDLVHGSDSLIDMFRDKINKTVYQHNANSTNNKTTNIYATFGDIVSNNPETFAKFMKDYLERVKSESGIF